MFGDVWRCLEARFNAPSGLVISTDPRRVPDLGRGKTALKKYILGVSHRDRTDQNRHELTPIWKAFSVLHSKNMQKPLHLRSQTFASQNGVVTVAPVRCQTATRNGVSTFSIIFHHFPQTATNLMDLSAWAGNMWSSGSTQQCFIQMSFPDGFVVIYYTILWPYYTIFKKNSFCPASYQVISLHILLTSCSRTVQPRRIYIADSYLDRTVWNGRYYDE